MLVGVPPMNHLPRTPAAPAAPSPASTAAATSGGPSLAHASGSMALATVISRLTGLVAKLLLAAALGFAVLNDSYNIANELPNMVYELLLGGVLSSVAIPVLVRAQRTDPDGGQAYTQRLLTMSTLALVVGTLGAVAAAPLLTRLSLSSGPHASPALATAFAYLLLPEILFYGLAALMGAVLNSRNVFGPPAWAPVANNLVVIAVVGAYALTPGRISLHPSLMDQPKLWVLGVGTTLGIVVQAAVLLPALRRSGFRWRWRWGWDPRLSSFGGLAGWVTLYVLAGQVGLVITYRIASATAAGGVATYAYAWMLLIVPYGVLGNSVLTALMPRISRASADGKIDEVVADLSLGTRISALLLLPISALLTVAGEQIATVLFSYGHSDLPQADRLGDTLAASAFGLLPYAVVLLQLRVFYALGDARTPTVIMALMVAGKIGLSLAAPVLLGPQQVVIGLAAANSASFVIGTAIGQVWLWHRLGHLQTRVVADTVARITVAAGVAATAGVAVLRLVYLAIPHAPPPVRAAAELAAATLLGGTILLLALRALRVWELQLVRRRAAGWVLALGERTRWRGHAG
ncbi:MAG: murein biosynthesis integral membrane protein MurJ [Pseudonocardiales bacterium]|nr:murein biosynthesis integral membrane protein MurJ [Pseudonocardiales bacterium]